MSKVYIVRHGESVWNLEQRLQGGQDPALSDAGYRQAARVAQALEGLRVAAVYSSPLRRASETARVIADALRVPLRVHGDLREIGMGEWEGLPYPELLGRHGEAYRAWIAAPADRVPPGGEPMAAFADRVKAVLGEVREKYPEEDTVLVTHGVVARVLVARTIGLDLNHIYRMRVSNCSLSCLTFEGDFPRVGLLNQVGHLDTRIGEDPYTMV
ncbi:MAG: histidine phosphatase family protein [candidate division NC10 bacterium]|nr:histidine phosphatase family protein [candidate division NC10 bacterium]